MAHLVGLDTETTGLTPPIGVVEIAYVRLDNDLNVLDEHCSLVNPGRGIEPGATGVHGITDEQVANAPDLASQLAPIADSEVIIIGHNCQFDINLVQDHLQIAGSVCTLALSRQYVKGSANHKLTTVTKHLGLPMFDAHRALGDTHMALNLLRWVMHETGFSLDTLVQRQSAPRLLTHMPFGKFAGLLMTQVPTDYLDWLRGQDSLDKDMRYTLDKLKDL